MSILKKYFYIYREYIKPKTLICSLFTLMFVTQWTQAACLKCGGKILPPSTSSFQLLCDKCRQDLFNPLLPAPNIKLDLFGSGSAEMIISSKPEEPVVSPRKRSRAVGSYGSLDSSECRTKVLKNSNSHPDSGHAEYESGNSDAEGLPDVESLDDAFETTPLVNFMNLLVSNHFSETQHIEVQQFLEVHNFVHIEEECLFDHLNQVETVFLVSWDANDTASFHQLNITNGMFVSEDISGVTEEFNSLSSFKDKHPDQHQFMWFHHKP